MRFAPFFLVSILDKNDWKPNHPQQQQQQQQRAERENEWKGIIDCPWLMIFPNFWIKRGGTCCCCCCCCHSFQVTNFGKWFVCLVHVSLIVCFGKTMQEEEGKVFKCFSLWLATGRGGRGRNWFIPRLQSFKAHPSTTEREENVWNCFNTKKAGEFVWLSNFEKILKQKNSGLWHNAENSLFSVNLRAKNAKY